MPASMRLLKRKEAPMNEPKTPLDGYTRHIARANNYILYRTLKDLTSNKDGKTFRS